MNILVYNFFDEPSQNIEHFINLTQASVFFAISISDVTRILKECDIDIAILKVENVKDDFFDKWTKLFFSTCFYLITFSEQISNQRNVFYYPPNTDLISITKNFLKNQKNK
jgi:hypothetical protein